MREHIMQNFEGADWVVIANDFAYLGIDGHCFDINFTVQSLKSFKV